MDEAIYVTSVVDDSVVTAVAVNDRLDTHAIIGGGRPIVLVNNYIADISFPAQLSIDNPGIRDVASAGVVIIPSIGGGRGPIINDGETITIALLQELLSGILTRTELGAALIAELDSIPLAIPNSKAQSGYATHDDTITLDHDWSGYPPVIDLNPSYGSTVGLVMTQVGIDPDSIIYVDTRDQELVYGHSGVVNDNQFTVKAAIVERIAPTIIALAWGPAGITGPPLTVESTLSPITNTTVDCMGLRIQGSLSLSTLLGYEVSGAMSLQVSVDSGVWVDVARKYWHFAANNPDAINEQFDVVMAYDHGPHSYQFRGRLVTDSDDELNRELTGLVIVDTVTEFGAGSVITNDLQIKWTSKE
jgi:hypothetical protein